MSINDISLNYIKGKGPFYKFDNGERDVIIIRILKQEALVIKTLENFSEECNKILLGNFFLLSKV